MTCTPFEVDGVRGIACTRSPAKRCKCGYKATLACDWKVATKRSGTCDAPLCARCTTSPWAGKDLCAVHKVEYQAWLERREAGRPAPADE